MSSVYAGNFNTPCFPTVLGNPVSPGTGLSQSGPKFLKRTRTWNSREAFLGFSLKEAISRPLDSQASNGLWELSTVGIPKRNLEVSSHSRLLSGCPSHCCPVYLVKALTLTKAYGSCRAEVLTDGCCRYEAVEHRLFLIPLLQSRSSTLSHP